MARYIDADALIRSINDSILKAIEWGKTASGEEIKIRAEQTIATFCEASLRVKEQPTADVVERKKGEWIRHPEQKNIYGGKCIECSVCGEKYVVQWIEDEKHCRNCGADMRKPMTIPKEIIDSVLGYDD